MQIIIRYKCEGCEEVYESQDEIYKCKICGVDICDYCSFSDDLCSDNCE